MEAQAFDSFRLNLKYKPFIPIKHLKKLKGKNIKLIFDEIEIF